MKKSLLKYNRLQEYDFEKGYDSFDTSHTSYTEKISLESLLENDYRSYLDYLDQRTIFMPLEYYSLASLNSENLSNHYYGGFFDYDSYENSDEYILSEKLSKEFKSRQQARNINRKINNYFFDQISNFRITNYALEKIYTLIDQVYEQSTKNLNKSIECEFYLLSKPNSEGNVIIRDIFFELPQYNTETTCEGLFKNNVRKAMDLNQVDYDIFGWSHSHGNFPTFFSEKDNICVNSCKHYKLLNIDIDYDNESLSLLDNIPISIVFNRSRQNPAYRVVVGKPRVVYNTESEQNMVVYDKIDICNLSRNNFSNNSISLSIVEDEENNKVDVDYIRRMVHENIISYYKNPVKFTLDTGSSPIEDKVIVNNDYNIIKRIYNQNSRIIFVDPETKKVFDARKFIADYERNLLSDDSEIKADILDNPNIKTNQVDNSIDEDDSPIDVEYTIIDKAKTLDDKAKTLDDKAKTLDDNTDHFNFLFEDVPSFEVKKKRQPSENLSDLVDSQKKRISLLEERVDELNIENSFLQRTYINLLDKYCTLEKKIKDPSYSAINHISGFDVSRTNYRSAIKEYCSRYPDASSDIGLVSRLLSGDYKSSIDNFKNGDYGEKQDSKRLWRWTDRYNALLEVYNRDNNYFKDMNQESKSELLEILTNNNYLSRNHKQLKKDLLKLLNS